MYALAKPTDVMDAKNVAMVTMNMVANVSVELFMLLN